MACLLAKSFPVWAMSFKMKISDLFFPVLLVFLIAGALHVFRNDALLDDYSAGHSCEFIDKTHSRI
jgi:hypothetical protein